jgi:antitoxin (DNA-binding transcriptional repressor) of toxin-antitoxin stability system
MTSEITGGATMFHNQMSIQKRDVNLDELLALTRNGAEVLIMEGDHLLAKIVPPDAGVQPRRISTRTPDLHPGLWMSDDFDDPLPDEFWLGDDQ